MTDLGLLHKEMVLSIIFEIQELLLPNVLGIPGDIGITIQRQDVLHFHNVILCQVAGQLFLVKTTVPMSL